MSEITECKACFAAKNGIPTLLKLASLSFNPFILGIGTAQALGFSLSFFSLLHLLSSEILCADFTHKKNQIYDERKLPRKLRLFQPISLLFRTNQNYGYLSPA